MTCGLISLSRLLQYKLGLCCSCLGNSNWYHGCSTIRFHLSCRNRIAQRSWWHQDLDQYGTQILNPLQKAASVSLSIISFAVGMSHQCCECGLQFARCILRFVVQCYSCLQVLKPKLISYNTSWLASFLAVAVKLVCQGCKYGLQFVGYVLGFMVEFLLILWGKNTKTSAQLILSN